MSPDDLVHWSVMEANRLHGREIKKHGIRCSNCGSDGWQTSWGVKSEYRSQYNPGEYCEFTCANCGYSYESPC